MNFRPSVAGVVVTCIGVGVFSSLGVWQLNRADEKRQIHAAIEERVQQPPLLYSGQDLDLDDVRYRRVTLRGRYLGDAQLLMDNRTHNGKVGYEVITPLAIADHENWVVLVNRGWVPAGRDRRVLPEVAVPEGLVSIEGRADKPRSRPVIAAEKPETELAGRWTWLDLDYFGEVSGLSPAPFVVLLAPDTQGGLVRDWPDYEAKVGMHIGYAIQWFAFAVIALGTFIGIAIRRGKPEQVKK